MSFSSWLQSTPWLRRHLLTAGEQLWPVFGYLRWGCQVGWSSKQPGLVEDVPAHGSGVGTR